MDVKLYNVWYWCGDSIFKSNIDIVNVSSKSYFFFHINEVECDCVQFNDKADINGESLSNPHTANQKFSTVQVDVIHILNVYSSFESAKFSWNQSETKRRSPRIF